MVTFQRAVANGHTTLKAPAGSRPITEVKQRRARLVLEWVHDHLGTPGVVGNLFVFFVIII